MSNTFQRQTWLMLGVALGIGVTNWLGWLFALSWFIGGVVLPWIAYAFLCGYAWIGVPRAQSKKGDTT